MHLFCFQNLRVLTSRHSRVAGVDLRSQVKRNLDTRYGYRQRWNNCHGRIQIAAVHMHEPCIIGVLHQRLPCRLYHCWSSTWSLPCRLYHCWSSTWKSAMSSVSLLEFYMKVSHVVCITIEVLHESLPCCLYHCWRSTWSLPCSLYHYWSSTWKPAMSSVWLLESTWKSAMSSVSQLEFTWKSDKSSVSLLTFTWKFAKSSVSLLEFTWKSGQSSVSLLEFYMKVCKSSVSLLEFTWKSAKSSVWLLEFTWKSAKSSVSRGLLPQVLLPANPNAIPLGQTGTPLLVQLVVPGSLADCDRLFWPWTCIYRSVVLALEGDGRCLKWMSPSVIRGSFKNRTAHIDLTLDKNAYLRGGYIQLFTRERERQRQRHREIDREREIIFLLSEEIQVIQNKSCPFRSLLPWFTF